MNLKNKIIIVDDQVLFRKGIKTLLESENIGEVIAEAENGSEFLFLLENKKPDLVLINYEIPAMDGWDLIKKAISKCAELKVLVFNLICQRDNYNDLINAGAVGFLYRTSGKPELEIAIKTVLNGENYFPGEPLRGIAINSKKQSLFPVRPGGGKSIDFSSRELEILKCFCEGLTACEIADKYCRSIKTIEVHRSKLLQKTASKNTINLVLFAIKNKLVHV
ncbi:MAG TPA: response regulator transcription factor [Prolixibacteraceae bacterium]